MKLRSIAYSLSVAAALAAFPASAASLSGKSVTQGGSKPFCKGSTPITGSVDGSSISITTPKADGGSATVKGKVAKTGAFKAQAGRFSFTGKVDGGKVSGKWKGPSCYGSFSLS